MITDQKDRTAVVTKAGHVVFQWLEDQGLEVRGVVLIAMTDAGLTHAIGCRDGDVVAEESLKTALAILMDPENMQPAPCDMPKGRH
jgi:hypothetical protein